MVKRIGQGARKLRRTYFREWRDHRGLTQAQLAERMGTTKAAVSKMELGQNVYNQSSLEAWAEALQCEPSDLISRGPKADDLRSLIEGSSEAMKALVLNALRKPEA